MNDHTPAAQDDLGAPEIGNCESGSLSVFRNKARKAGFNETEIDRLVADYMCLPEEVTTKELRNEHR